MSKEILNQVKDEVARKHGYRDWQELFYRLVYPKDIEKYQDESALAYHERISKSNKKTWDSPDVKEVFEYASLHALVAGFDLTIHQRGDAKKELGQLLAWKESAMKILNSVDDQEIGKLLGVPLGESVHENLLPKIRELKAMVGYRHSRDYDKLWKLINCGHRIPGWLTNKSIGDVPVRDLVEIKLSPATGNYSIGVRGHGYEGFEDGYEGFLQVCKERDLVFLLP